MPEHFTPEKANALLPRLRQLLPHMQARKRQLDQVQKKLVDLAIRAAGDGHLAERELKSAEQQAERLSGEIDKMLEQIRALGCQVKDINQGIVDFPDATRAGGSTSAGSSVRRRSPSGTISSLASPAASLYDGTAFTFSTLYGRR